MKFKHYVITRFNLSNKWSEDKLNNKVLDTNWLKNRYILFENYCLPSMLSQTNKNFEWFVYFDTDTSEEFILKNKAITEKFKNFQPKYIDSYQEFEVNYINEINKDAQFHNLDFVLTTRLDNDDALNMFFIEELQKTNLNGTKLLEFPTGLTLNINNNLELREYNSRYNPFISLLEKVDDKNDALGIYKREHGNWKGFDTEIISDKPFWIQVIHEKNLYNRAKGDLVLPGKLKNFKIEKPFLSFRYRLPIIIKKIKKIIKSL
tara:strand:+ start:6950 stop:7735 length:786 start_codon:yes stop_codon:yes gene_type:complete